MVGEPKQPGKFWYWVAGLLVLAGLAAGVALGVRGVSSFSRVISELARVPIPGTAQLDLEPGGHVIYLEQSDTGALPAVDVEVRHDGSGESVDVRRYAGELNYNSGGVSGTAVATFDVVEAGVYEVVVDGAEGSGTVAIGPSLGGGVLGLVGGLFGAFGVASLTFFAAVAIVVVVAVRRNRAQKAGAPAR